MWFLLLWMQFTTLPLSPVDHNETVRFHRSVSLGPQGEYLANTDHALFLWRTDGTLETAIRLDANLGIGTYHFDGAHFLVCTIPRDAGPDNLFTHVYTRKGEFLTKFLFHTMYFKQAGDKLFVHPYELKKPTIFPYKHPFQLREFTYKVAGGKIDYKVADDGFCKMTSLQREMAYNFKQVWVVFHNGAYYTMDQLAARVVKHTLTTSKREKSGGPNRATSLAGMEVVLPDFRPMRQQYQPAKAVMAAEEARKAYTNYWYSHSRITGFHKLGDGFVVGFEVPVCKNGDCSSSELALQPLDGQFQPLGKPIRRDGMLMGTRGKAAYIFHPDPKIADNGPITTLRPRVSRLAISKDGPGEKKDRESPAH